MNKATKLLNLIEMDIDPDSPSWKSGIMVFEFKEQIFNCLHVALYEVEDCEDQIGYLKEELATDPEFGLVGRTDLVFIPAPVGTIRGMMDERSDMPPSMLAKLWKGFGLSMSEQSISRHGSFQEAWVIYRYAKTKNQGLL
jgi:hypothetical protein